MYVNAQKTTHTSELNLLHRAVQGDPAAMHEVIQYLSSANPYLRQIMRDALHECQERAVWRGLVCCFGEHCWTQQTHDIRMDDPEAAQRLDETIVQIFVEDRHDFEGALKHEVLCQALEDDLPAVRFASAYLLGVRGDQAALPVLAEVLDKGKLVWQMRAIQALEMIHLPESGPLLLLALASDQDDLHRAAARSLDKISLTVRDTLLNALEHPDPHVRWHVARKLVALGDERGLDLVLGGLLSESRAIRNASAEALAHLGASAVPHLLRVLSQPDLSQHTMQAVGYAMHSIHSFTIRERLQPLLHAMQSPATSSVVPSIAQHMLRENTPVV